MLIFDLIRPAYAFTGVSFGLIVFGILPVELYIKSFANQSILIIFLLIFLARTIRENFNVFEWLDVFFGQTKNPRWFLFKQSLGVSALSSVMNNTPIVATMIPYSMTWGKKNGISPSKILLPLSYAAITGGMITVIGTSTNLVLNGFLEANQMEQLSLWDYLVPGILVSVATAIYSSTFGYNVLPNLELNLPTSTEIQKDYLVECTLTQLENGGEDVESLGLRHLEGTFLAEVIRDQQIISPVHPKSVLQKGDRLFFAGDKEASIKLVSSHPKLEWSKSQKFNISKENAIVEAVVPYNSSIANSTLKKFDFRLKFNSAVIGIHRNGEKLTGKLGEIVIRPGDLLIIIAGDDFQKLQRNQRDLYVINGLKKGIPTQNKNYQNKKVKFLMGSGFMLVLMLLNYISFFTMLLGMLGFAFLTKLTNSIKIKQEFNLELLMILGSAISLGLGLQEVGAGAFFLNLIEPFVPFLGTWGIVIIIGFLTVLLTNFVTNIAAISIIFPLVMAVLPIVDIAGSVLFLIVAFSASAAFITPVGYQTNIMVQGPGGYTQKDYFVYGVPMTMIYFAVLFTYLQFL